MLGMPLILTTNPPSVFFSSIISQKPKLVSFRLFSILETAAGVFLELGTKHG